jgi:hypothetical protein
VEFCTVMKSWRGRYLNRMVTSISKAHAAKSSARPRLFPYGIVDDIAASKKPTVTAAAPKPVLPKPTEAATAPSKQTSWHFIKK